MSYAAITASSNRKQTQLEEVESMKELSCVPPGTEALWITDCPELETVASLPQSLKRLSIRNCPKLARLPHTLPNLAEWFFMRNLPRLTALPAIPRTLHKLHAEKCGIRGLPDLRECYEMDRLVLLGCEKLASWPDHLPPLLEYLAVENCGEPPAVWQEALPKLWPGCFPFDPNDDSRDPANPHEETSVMRWAARKRHQERVAELETARAMDAIKFANSRLDEALKGVYVLGQLS